MVMWTQATVVPNFHFDYVQKISYNFLISYFLHYYKIFCNFEFINLRHILFSVVREN